MNVDANTYYPCLWTLCSVAVLAICRLMLRKTLSSEIHFSSFFRVGFLVVVFLLLFFFFFFFLAACFCCRCIIMNVIVFDKGYQIALARE